VRGPRRGSRVLAPFKAPRCISAAASGAVGRSGDGAGSLGRAGEGTSDTIAGESFPGEVLGELCAEAGEEMECVVGRLGGVQEEERAVGVEGSEGEGGAEEEEEELTPESQKSWRGVVDDDVGVEGSVVGGRVEETGRRGAAIGEGDDDENAMSSPISERSGCAQREIADGSMSAGELEEGQREGETGAGNDGAHNDESIGRVQAIANVRGGWEKEGSMAAGQPSASTSTYGPSASKVEMRREPGLISDTLVVQVLDLRAGAAGSCRGISTIEQARAVAIPGQVR